MSSQPHRSSWRSLADSSVSSLITAPVIYFGIIPIVMLDIFITVFQALCFKGYFLEKVDRKGFILMDRHSLGYLNWVERINCDYCAYVNGVIAYAREVAGRTEGHFCPIRNATLRRHPHAQYKSFFEFGDAKPYLEEVKAHLKRNAEV